MPQPLAFWQNASTLIITIQSIEGVDRVATRTNHLRMYSSPDTIPSFLQRLAPHTLLTAHREIKKDGNLRDWQEFSSQTDIVVIVSGDWGPMEAPRVVSLLAIDAPCDAAPGFSTQDVLQLTFNLPTHQPPMPNSSRVDAYLFTYDNKRLCLVVAPAAAADTLVFAPAMWMPLATRCHHWAAGTMASGRMPTHCTLSLAVWLVSTTGRLLSTASPLL